MDTYRILNPPAIRGCFFKDTKFHLLHIYYRTLHPPEIMVGIPIPLKPQTLHKQVLCRTRRRLGSGVPTIISDTSLILSLNLVISV